MLLTLDHNIWRWFLHFEGSCCKMDDSMFWVPWNEVKSRRAARLNYLVSWLGQWKIWVFLSWGPAVMWHRAAFIGLNDWMLHPGAATSLLVSWLITYFLNLLNELIFESHSQLTYNHTVGFPTHHKPVLWDDVRHDIRDLKFFFSYKYVVENVGLSVFTARAQLLWTAGRDWSYKVVSENFVK